MSTFAILATGASMSQSVADSVRGRCKVIAVSDAYRLAPWADAMVSSDPQWWRANPDALQFQGCKYRAKRQEDVAGVLGVSAPSGSNSGLLALVVAEMLGATKALLLGYDMGGTHFFGPHTKGLANTTASRFETFKKQFTRWQTKIEVVNCTNGSALHCYRFSTVEREL
jgi:hypothetical protein